METEDNADKGISEAHKQHTRQGGQGMEEKPSVQASIAIKGTRNGLLLTLEPEIPFSELLNALAGRLAEAPTFFRGASLSVDTSRRALRVSERTQLENLLAHYQMSIQPFEQGTEGLVRSQTGVLKEARMTVELSPPDVSTEVKYSTSNLEEYRSLVKWIKTADGYIDKLVLPRLDEEQRKHAEVQIRDRCLRAGHDPGKFRRGDSSGGAHLRVVRRRGDGQLRLRFLTGTDRSCRRCDR